MRARKIFRFSDPGVKLEVAYEKVCTCCEWEDKIVQLQVLQAAHHRDMHSKPNHLTSDGSHLPPTRVSKLEAIPHCGPLICKMRFSFRSGLVLRAAFAFA